MFTLLHDTIQPAQLAPDNGTADNAAVDNSVIAGLYSEMGIDLSILPEAARRLFEFSINAFDAFVHAWMSELPIERETLAFGRGVLAAAQNAVPAAGRNAADRAASDRGNPDVLTVTRAAYQVWHEIDRMRGFLRFSPTGDGVYLARCEPDHYILPALQEHFALRFGGTPWVVIDEKRSLSIGTAAFAVSNTMVTAAGDCAHNSTQGGWEALWKQYHQTINNESRNNPALQRRFMPQRYRKYLTEL